MPAMVSWGGAFFRSERLSRGRRLGEQDNAGVEYSPVMAESYVGQVTLLLDWADSSVLDRSWRFPEDRFETPEIRPDDFIIFDRGGLDDLIGDFEFQSKIDLDVGLTQLFNAVGDLSSITSDRFDQIFGQDMRDFAGGFDMAAAAARIDLGAISAPVAISLGDFG